MIGLIKKDFFTLWSQGRFMMAIAFFYMLIGIASRNSYMLTFAVIFVGIMPLSVMGFDENCKWDTYAVMLPYSRTQLVLSRYLFGILCVGLVVVLSLLAEGIWRLGSGSAGMFNLNQAIEFAVTSFLMVTFFLGVNLPFAFKVGVEKGRMALLLGGALLVAFFKLFDFIKNDMTGVNQLVVFLSDQSTRVYMLRNLLYFGSGLLILLISSAISILVYRKKEF